MDKHPLRSLCSLWLRKIEAGQKKKASRFGKDADYAMKFLQGPYSNWLYSGDGASKNNYMDADLGGDSKAPSMRMTVNKVAELQQIFGPALYSRNPVRTVTARKPVELPPQLFGDMNNPQMMMAFQQAMMQQQQATFMDEARASLISKYLNFTPAALDLKSESRWAIDEALVKGMGCLWTQTKESTASDMMMVGTFYDSVDNLVMDPDVENFRDIKWMSQKCTHPYMDVEDEYKLPRDSLKRYATEMSTDKQARNANNPSDENTCDLITYWKVWSKMGPGGRLKDCDPDLREPLEGYGRYAYIVVAENCPYLLNLPDETLFTASDADIQKAFQWPTPFWADDSWPMTPIAFHWAPREIWPVSHIKPALGELIFLNWAYSFLASKVKVTCRDFIAIAKAAGKELREQIMHGADLTMIEVEASLGKSIDQLVTFLQHPPMNADIFKIIEGVTKNFEQRTGLTELVYGLSGRQMRSAEEAQVKGDQISVRPDDMANRVEDAMSDVSRKEAIAAQTHIKGQHVLPVMGATGAYFWDMLVSNSDPGQIVHQLEFRIEAGSARKPNRAKEVADMNQAMQNLFPVLVQYGQTTGNVGPVNALITQWAKAQDWDATPFLLPPPPMPMMPGPQLPGPGRSGPSQGPPQRGAA